MGAYGYRGFFERKPRFLESVPYAARNVAGLLDAGMPIALPELESVFHRIVEAWADLDRPVDRGGAPRLAHRAQQRWAWRDLHRNLAARRLTSYASLIAPG